MVERPARMWRDRRGSISILAALMLPILMALAALVVDCGYALSQRAALQQAADSAALSGAMAYISSASATATRATINDVVTANGWASSTIVAGSTGYLAASPTDASVHAVQVTLTATSPLWFGAVFVSRSALGLQAYALANLPGETACIISLGTLTINSVVNAGTCDVAADSTASYAVQINSPGGLTAGKFYSPGTITDDGYLHATIVTKTLSDPYTAVQTAATSGFSSCSSYKYYTSGTSTMSPGCWDSPTITSAVTLSPGVYYMNYGMTLQSGGSITGTGGVTIVSSTGLAVAGNITLTAPTSGSYSGIALYVQDGGIDFDNGVKYAINGAVYAPNLSSGGLTFDTGTSNQNACTTLVAGNISFNSGATFNVAQASCTQGSSGGSLGLAE